jgi:hypothetical protein
MVSTEVYTEVSTLRDYPSFNCTGETDTQSHQLARLPNSHNAPRRPPLAKEEDLEESLSIDFGSTRPEVDRNASSSQVDKVDKATGVRFQDMMVAGSGSAFMGQ